MSLLCLRLTNPTGFQHQSGPLNVSFSLSFYSYIDSLTTLMYIRSNVSVSPPLLFDDNHCHLLSINRSKNTPPNTTPLSNTFLTF